jgi:hypothetical protein
LQWRTLMVCWTGLCSQVIVGRFGETSEFLDVVCRCEVRAHGPSMATPFIKLIGDATAVTGEVASGWSLYFLYKFCW